MTIGEKLHQLRLSLGINQEELSQGVISITTLSRVENEVNSISADDLIDLLRKNKLPISKFLEEFVPVSSSLREHELLIMQAYEKKQISKLEELEKDSIIAKGIFKYFLEDMIRVLKKKNTHYQEIVYKKINLMRGSSELFLWCLWCALVLYPQGDFYSIAEEELRKTEIKDFSNWKIYFTSKIALLMAERADQNSDRQIYAVKFLKGLPRISEVFEQKRQVY